MKRSGIRSVLALAMLFFMIAPVWAHHGFTGRYDLSVPIWLEGVVTAAYFGQPHPEVTLRTDGDLALPIGELDLASAEDTIRANLLTVRPGTQNSEVTIEFAPIARFFDLGSPVSIGDRIAVIAFRNCDEPHQLRGQWIWPEGAEPIARPGRLSYQMDSC